MMKARYHHIYVALFLLSVLMSATTAGCAGTTWDYVAFGGSGASGYGVEKSYVDSFAEFIEQDLGITVNVQNYARAGQTVGRLLTLLREDDEHREAIQDAEVITIWPGIWNDLSGELELYRREECGGDDNLDCIREEVAELNADLEAILDEIVSLANPQETLIRVAVPYIPFVGSWQYKGWFDILLEPCYLDWRSDLIAAAEARGITVVDMYHALNGPDGDQPLDDDITQSDGWHLNDEGQLLLARLHRDAGYEYAP
jgi:lysophospholipase L1-like esterase